MRACKVDALMMEAVGKYLLGRSVTGVGGALSRTLRHEGDGDRLLESLSQNRKLFRGQESAAVGGRGSGMAREEGTFSLHHLSNDCVNVRQIGFG